MAVDLRNLLNRPQRVTGQLSDTDSLDSSLPPDAEVHKVNGKPSSTRLLGSMTQRIEQRKEELSALTSEDGAWTGESVDARMFAMLATGMWLWNLVTRKWMHFNGCRWITVQYTPRNEIREILNLVYRDTILPNILKSIAEKRKNGVDIDKNDPDLKAREQVERKLSHLQKRRFLDNVENLARDHLKADEDEFDRDPMLLNLTNGTLDLRHATLREHSPGDKLTKQACVSYDATADAPEFRKFVMTIFRDDADLARYVRKLLGYSLTAQTDLDKTAFFLGDGSNGKSTLLGIMQGIFNDYAAGLTAEAVLMQSRAQRDSHSESEKANLKGARLAIVSELPDERRLNEAMIKDLCGGDLINARRLYGEPFRFAPTHKLILCGNHRPEIRGQDIAIWRRISVIPFDHQFPEGGRPRKEIINTMLDKEGSGILNWLIDGLNELTKEGLEPVPRAVQAKTEAYRNENNTLAQFIDEECSVDARSRVTVASFSDHFREYCARVGTRQPSKKVIHQMMTRAGYRSARGAGGTRFWEGLSIQSE